MPESSRPTPTDHLAPPDRWTEDYWRTNVYQGYRMPEYRLRAKLVGCAIGILLVAVTI